MMHNKNQFWSDLVRIALPIAMTNFIISSVNIVDTVMVGRLGATELAAVGLGNQVFFLLILLLFGISSGAGIFVAQYWGKKDIPGIRRTTGLSLLLGLAAALLFTIIAVSAPQLVLRFYSKDPAVIASGAAYLRIVALSYPFAAASFSFSLALRGVERVRLPLVATLVSLSVNVALNYLLIFGKFGLPALGVRGAAIATIVSRIIECAITVIGAYRRKTPPAGSLSELMAWRGAFAARYARITTPVVINEFAWAFGITVYNLVFARISTNAIAAFSVTTTISQLANVFFLGTANAAAVMIGKCIGEGDREKAFSWAFRFAWMSPLLGLLMTGLLLPVRWLIPVLFSINSDAIAQATMMTLVLALAYPFKVFNLHFIVGICRAGGDTKFGAFFDIFGVWGIGVPLAFLGAFVLKLEPWAVFILVNSEEFFKMFLGIWRMAKRAWMNDVTV